MNHKITITITDEQVDNIVCSALEGGITHWCDGANPVVPKGKKIEWGHEALTRGGHIWLHNEDTGKSLKLTLPRLLKGIQKYGKHDFDDYDSQDADNVVQLALFGEVVYG